MSNEEQEEIVKRLKKIESTLKKIEKKLEDEREEERAAPAATGMEKGAAHGVVESLGKMFPQLNDLLEGLKDSPAFQERLNDLDFQVESGFKTTGLAGTRAMGSIPPSVRKKSGTKPVRRTGTRGGGKQKVKVGSDVSKGIPVDVFDENGVIKVIAELPGYEENEVKVQLEGESLAIDTTSTRQNKHGKVELPCAVEKKYEMNFRNGVLEVLLKKTKEKK